MNVDVGVVCGDNQYQLCPSYNTEIDDFIVALKVM